MGEAGGSGYEIGAVLTCHSPSLAMNFILFVSGTVRLLPVPELESAAVPVPGVMVPVLSSVWRSCLGVTTNADLSFILVARLEVETPVTTESSVELRLDSTSNKLDFLMMLGAMETTCICCDLRRTLW